MSRKKPRVRGTSVVLEFSGADFLDHNHDIPTMCKALGDQVEQDQERPEIKCDSIYRLELLFVEIGQKGRA